MSTKKSKILPIDEAGIKGAQIEEYQNDPSQFTLLSFQEDTDIKIISKSSEELVFDITGIEPPVANALRRILIGEIPTMAIETVIIHQNTSIIPDEVLSHRLGLIPIFANADDFQYKRENDEFNENNSLTFKLQVKCYKDKNGEIVNGTIHSDKLIFVPKGKQAEKFVDDEAIRPVYNDILINKLRPGQEIDIECICVKGIGRTHAKWSPVCTAYYRLLSDIQFTKEFTGHEALELKSLCPTGVFDVKNNKLYVRDARKCTTCRECIRNEKFKQFVQLGKVSDHYEFHIESVGIYEAEELFYRALRVLKEKVEMWTGILLDKAASSERKLSTTK